MTDNRIPDTDLAFNSFLVTIHTYLNITPPGGVTNAERLGTSALALSVFNEKYVLWAANWLLHENPLTQTEAVNLTKENLRDALDPVIRDIQNKADVSDNVTDDDRVVLHVPERDTTRTRIEAPTVAPDITIEKREHLEVTIRLHNPEDPETNAKPDGVEAVEVFQFIGDNPPALKDWSYVGSTGRFLFPINYLEEDTKKTAHIAARYRNPRGETGPWSDPVEVDIS